MDWSQLPDITDVYEALQQQAQLKAELAAAKLMLEIYQAELCQQKPRSPSVKLIGVDEESRTELQRLFAQVAAAEMALDIATANVKFNAHRFEAAKAMSYAGKV